MSRTSARRDNPANIPAGLFACPLCGLEMNSSVECRTIYGSIYGPRMDLKMRRQCSGDSCRYFERTTVEARDKDSFVAVERQFEKFLDALPRLGNWKRAKVTNGQIGPYRRRK